MKITIISSTACPANYNFYGSEWTNYVLAKYLGKLGHKVTLIAAAKSLKSEFYDLKLIPFTKGIFDYSMENLAFENYKDIILSSDFVIDASALCTTCENIYFWNREWLKEHIIVYYRNGYDSFCPRFPVSFRIHGVWLSNVIIEKMEPIKIPRKLCHVIPYGLDLDLFEYEERKRDIDVLYVGGCRKDKINSFFEIVPKLKNKKFVFVLGTISNEHKKNFEDFKKIEDMGDVEFVLNPSFEEKLEFYRRAKYMVTFTDRNYFEAFGLTNIEAMSQGCIPIRESWGGSREIIENGSDGFLVDSIEQVVEIVSKGLEVDRKKCIEKVQKYYNGERFAKDFLDLYEKLKINREVEWKRLQIEKSSLSL
jgi:glycosyltransferase involved in cell wall biosynthesis